MTKIDIRSLVIKILPYGRFEQYEYIALNPTRKDNNLGSFRINTRTGTWSDFATGDKGKGSVSLYAYVKGINYKEAVRECYDYRSFTYKNPLPKKTKDISSYIKTILDGCSGYRLSPVEKYLANRGITALVPNTLLYHPKLYHNPTSREHPTMIGLVMKCGSSDVIGIHRTYLNTNGYKADIKPNKMMLGDIKGGAVRFGEIDDTVILAEGIETALSLWQSTKIATWACLSSTNMLEVVPPPLKLVRNIIIAEDADKAGKRASGLLAKRLITLSYNVSIVSPPENMDFNDVLLK